MFCLLPFLLGELFFLHPIHVLLVVATMIAPDFLPPEMSICCMRHLLVTDALKKAVGIGDHGSKLLQCVFIKSRREDFPPILNLSFGRDLESMILDGDNVHDP